MAEQARPSSDLPEPRRRVPRLDEIEWFALTLIAAGMVLVAWNAWLEPPTALGDAVARSAPNWAPGLVTDGILLWVVNGIFRRHERKRVLSQMGSLSREFALDAVRRSREEQWLHDGSLAGQVLSRAALQDAHLAHAALRDVDLSYADLEGATLIHADLRNANLTGAHLAGADLRWADLRGAALQWADLRDAHIEGAKLEGVDARFASIDARQAGDPALDGAVVGGFLDQDQIREIRRTFDLLAARGTRPVERFYERLFELAPETRAMFRTDPRHQAAKFLHSLRVIVSALGAPRRHVEMLKGLGARHRGYGVEASHYAPVTEAFLAAFAEALGPELTPEATAAWRRAFDLMATVMTGGATAADEPGPVDSTRSGAPGTNGEVGAAGEPAYRSAPTRTPA